MILPTKRLSEDRALLAVGGEILYLLDEPKTISRLWAEINRTRDRRLGTAPLTFDWFVLSLDFLYIIKAIDLSHGLVTKTQK